MRSHARLMLLGTMLASLAAACSDEGDIGIGIGGGDRYAATLSGANVRPAPVTTSATATAAFAIREPDIGSTNSTLTYTLDVTGLTSVTAARMRLGGASVSDGPILLTLFSNPTDTAITATRVASGSVIGTSIGGGVSLDSLAILMKNGNAYVEIVSDEYPGGILRGQIAPSGQQPRGDLFAAPTLAGANERPDPVTSTATGSATFELLATGGVRYQVKVTGLTGATMAHIHTGVADSAGPVAVTLFTTTTPTGSVSGTLASGTFTEADITQPDVSLDSLLYLMRRGRTYVNVHTTANPTGEIRGQIAPVTVLPD